VQVPEIRLFQLPAYSFRINQSVWSCAGSQKLKLEEIPSGMDLITYEYAIGSTSTLSHTAYLEAIMLLALWSSADWSLRKASEEMDLALANLVRAKSVSGTAAAACNPMAKCDVQPQGPTFKATVGRSHF
jgi:hypothetical protein